MAAYAIAHGLADLPLLGFGFGGHEAIVAKVSLETDDAVDDIRIDYEDGGTTFVQAKRRLTDGPQFASAVAQWRRAGESGLDVTKHRLVIITGSLSQPMRDLQALLLRYSSDTMGGLTVGEARTLARLDVHLQALSTEDRAAVLRCASIFELDVENPLSVDARVATSLLSGTVCTAEHAELAWRTLVASAGQMARRRAGYAVSGWLDELRAAKVDLVVTGHTRSVQLERMHRAIEAYFAEVRRVASVLDLRSLGAAIPPIDLKLIDAEIGVHTDPADSRTKGKLAWVALRRGRVVLTGLPGGGKSTAMAEAAAQLVDIPLAPLPVIASLREMFPQDRRDGFRERLLSVVSRWVRTEEREPFQRAIEERLDDGRILLLLDGLDETYERRGEVVAELDRFLRSVHDDVGVVLATRDVAYGQASTLGWSSVRLAKPEHIAKTVNSVLDAAAATRKGLSEGTSEVAEQWKSKRLTWINSALAHDATLAETPLLPILLTLLAVERDTAALPSRRVRILLEVVDAVVDRHERRRRDRFRFGVLEGTDAHAAALAGFAVEAATILAGGGQAAVEEVADSVSSSLGDRWGLSPGHAASAAKDIVRFWDEHGVFVISNSAQHVAPRVALFAEVGDAKHAMEDRDKMDNWVADRFAAGKLEPLILAAGLSPAAAHSLAALTIAVADQALAHAVVQAVNEGAAVSPEEIDGVRGVLLADAQRPDSEGWQSWNTALQLAGSQGRAEGLAVLNSYPPAYRMLAQARLDLAEQSATDLVKDPELLLRILALRRLPRLPSRSPAGTPDWRDWLQDDFLGSTQLKIAEMLIGRVDQAAKIMMTDIGERPSGLHDKFLSLLADNGYTDEVRVIRRQQLEAFASTFAPLADFDVNRHRQLLAVVADLGQPSVLTPMQVTRMEELADYVETLNLNEVSAWHLLKRADDLPQVVRLLATLGGFDLNVLSTQASLVIERMESTDDHAPFFSLFDQARRRDLNRWPNVDDRAAAIHLAGTLFLMGRGSAAVALNAFWQFPEPAAVAPMLRKLLDLAKSSPDHQRLVALALYSLRGTPEPECWLDSDDPVLRRVLAETCPMTTGGRLSPSLSKLLDDGDGNVRAEAIRRLEKVRATGRSETLARLAASLDPGWMCWSCRTENPQGLRSCRRKGCYRAAPDPAAIAARLLRGESATRTML